MVGRGVVVAAAALLLGSTSAWADREVRIEPGAFVVTAPDEWATDGLYLKEGVVFERPGDVFVATIEILRGTSCDEMREWSSEKHPRPLTAWEARGSWVGKEYGHDDGQNRGDYCREVTTADGTTVVFWVEAVQADIDRVLGIAAGAVERSDVAAVPATGTHVVRLAVTNLEITVPASWSTTLRLANDTVVEGERTLGQVLLKRGTCAGLLEQARAIATDMSPRTDMTGWTGFQGTIGDHVEALFCRAIPPIKGEDVSILVSSSDPGTTRTLLDAVDAALVGLARTTAAAAADVDSSVTPTDEAPRRTLYDLVGPGIELGIFLPRTDDPALTCTPCFGGSAAVARLPWQNDGIAWSYRGRIAGASGGGTYATVEAGLGLGKTGEAWSIAVQGLAGYGSGRNAPADTHLGVEGALRYLARERHIGVGFGVSYAKLWRDDGDAMRFRIDFIGAGRRNGLTAGFGYERLLEADVITLNFGWMRLSAVR